MADVESERLRDSVRSFMGTNTVSSVMSQRLSESPYACNDVSNNVMEIHDVSNNVMEIHNDVSNNVKLIYI